MSDENKPTLESFRVVVRLIRVKQLDKFLVWIDMSCGLQREKNWIQNSPAQPLSSALVESIECQDMGFPTIITTEDDSPIEDGPFTL